MTISIQKPGDVLYLIWDPIRKGYLTWMHDDKSYLMGFTTGDKAEEYNEIVLRHRAGEIRFIEKARNMDLARQMVDKGIDWMVVDYPIANDKYDAPARSIGRDYGIVHLKALVK